MCGFPVGRNQLESPIQPLRLRDIKGCRVADLAAETSFDAREEAPGHWRAHLLNLLQLADALILANQPCFRNSSGTYLPGLPENVGDPRLHRRRGCTIVLAAAA